MSMDTQNSLSQEPSSTADMDSMGVSDQDLSQESGSSSNADEIGTYDPIKKRLGMQAKKHEREMRAMQAQISQLHSAMGQGQGMPNDGMQQQDPYATQSPGLNVEEQIKRAVQYAMNAQDEQKRMALDADRQAHVHKQYQRMNDEFDKASDKYDDFDDVVRGQDVPFTPAMRDTMLLIDNPSEVAYKLGKNRDELSRISKLHPVDQAREVNKLSFALMGGRQPTSTGQSSMNGKTISNPAPKPVANSSSMTPQAIRARMKNGSWK